MVEGITESPADTAAFSSTTEIKAKYYKKQKLYWFGVGYLEVVAVAMPKVWWTTRLPRYLLRHLDPPVYQSSWRQWYGEAVLNDFVMSWSYQRERCWRSYMVYKGCGDFVAEEESQFGYLDMRFTRRMPPMEMGFVDSAFC